MRKTIFNESHVLLEWEHENDNLTVTIAFRIYRSQGENLSNFYLLGETTKKTFTEKGFFTYKRLTREELLICITYFEKV